MIKRITIPLLSVFVTAICAAQAAPGYPYAAAPTSSGYYPYTAAPGNPGYNPYAAAPANPGYNPYADPAASGYVPYASAPALGYNPYAAPPPPPPAYNPYTMAGPDPSAYTAAPPTLTSEIIPVTPPWETGAIPWPVPWPTQAAREWLPELAQPWIPGTGKPVQHVRVQAPAPAPTPAPAPAPSTPVYFIITSSPAARSEPPAVRFEPSVNMAKVVPRMPGPQDTTQYWVQVGAYKTPSNAQEAFNRVAGAGFNPAYETSNELTRVVIPWVRGNEMQKTAERLYNAGFREILLRSKP